MRSLLLIVATCFIANLAMALGPQAARGQIEVPDCLVSAIDDVNVPAREAGVLMELPAKPGQQVEQGAMLGRIDDTRAKMDKKLAEIAYNETKTRSANDVNVRYAEKEFEVSESEYQRAKNANNGQEIGGAVSESELKIKELDAERAKLQIEQAKVTQGLIKYEVLSAAEQWRAADQAVSRRHITSPIDGEIFEVHRNRGEWVQAGETVVRVVRMNRLEIHGFLKEADHGRAAVLNHPVEIEVLMAGGVVEKFEGKIVFASSETTSGGEFRISAEIENRKQDDQWLLKPGQEAMMTIH